MTSRSGANDPQKRAGLAAGLALLALMTGGCTGDLPVPSFAPDAMSRQALADYDSNQDGFIDETEVQKSPGLRSCFRSLDKDGDRRLSAGEIADRLRLYLESNTALTTPSFELLAADNTFRGATVTLVPETFLAGVVKPATGVSDDSGQVTFQVEGLDVPGVQPGIYRVEVSLKDDKGEELLPACYNKQTVLGQEIEPSPRDGIVIRIDWAR